MTEWIRKLSDGELQQELEDINDELHELKNWDSGAGLSDITEAEEIREFIISEMKARGML